MWEKIWKAKTLPKIKAFAGKLAVNAIAVRDGLARRGVPIETKCPMYDQIETKEHLIWGCKWVKLVWEEFLGLQDVRDDCQTVNDWLMKRSSEGRSL